MRKIKNLIYIAIAALIVINLAGCKKLSSFEDPGDVGNASEVLKADNNYSTFVAALQRTGVIGLLDTEAGYTVLAPTNTAITKGGYSLQDINTMPLATLTTLVKNHIVAGKVDFNGISESQELVAESGLKIKIQKIDNLYYANGGDMLNLGFPVKNGSVTTLNTLLDKKQTLMDVIAQYSKTLAGNDQLTILQAAIAKAKTGGFDLEAILKGPTAYTFFAPVNSAFIDAGYATVAAVNGLNPAATTTLVNLLKYHLVPGAKLTTAFDSIPVNAYDGTTIYFNLSRRNVTPYTTMATNHTSWYANGVLFGNGLTQPSNLLADNGVIHVVKRPLKAPINTNTLTFIESTVNNSDPNKNLGLFLALVKRAGLYINPASPNTPPVNYEARIRDQAWTVFAVTNAGLIAIGIKNQADVDALSTEFASLFVRHHLVRGRENSINVAGASLPSNAGFQIRIASTASQGFTVQGDNNSTPIPVIASSGAPVFAPNMTTTNGILNVIGSPIR